MLTEQFSAPHDEKSPVSMALEIVGVSPIHCSYVEDIS